MFAQQITNLTLFYSLVAQAIAKTEISDLSDKLQKRWINAIGKAVVEIEENGEFISFDSEKNLLTVWSQKSNGIYTVNGHCECKASFAGQPCWHLSCKQLFLRYFEAVALQTVEVPLSQGRVALIDAEDAERVNQFKWTAHVKKNRKKQSFYARRSIWGKEKQVTIWLHRFIMNAPKDLQVDHINGNGLDNRKINLRLATNSQNHCNIPRENNWTGFRGVGRHRGSSKFYARIKKNGKQNDLGVFETAEEAAHAYDKKAVEIHGDFATLNFPENKRLYFEAAGYPPHSSGGGVIAANIASLPSDMDNSLYCKPQPMEVEKVGGIRI